MKLNVPDLQEKEVVSLTYRITIAAAIAFLIVFFVLITGCGRQADVILLGECNPLHGSVADMGEATHEGIALAVEEINSRGGILGKKMELRQEDDRGDGSEARTAFEKLINRDHVVGIIGEIISSNTMAAAPIAQTNKVPMITPAATNPDVTKAGDYVFRVCFTDDFQGAVCAAFAAGKLKCKRAAIFRDIKSDYSKGLADAFKKTFEAKGGKVVADSSYSAGDVDFKSQLTTIKAKNPDILFVPGYYPEISPIAVQARQLGIKIPMLGGDGWDSQTLIANAGQALEGCYFSNHFAPTEDKPAVSQFVKAFKDKYKKEPNAFSALGYDATWIMAESIKRAGVTTGESVRKALSETKDYPGVTGRITIDGNRNASKPAIILQVKGGQFVPITNITPDDVR